MQTVGRPRVARDTEGEEFRTLAMAFRAVADDLQHGLGELLSVPGIVKGGRYRAGGYMLSTVVLRALATECALKTLAIKRVGRYRREHDLTTLFDDLDEDIRAFVERIARQRGAKSVRMTLERHRSDFTEWRYPSKGIKTTHASDLDSVLDVLFYAIGIAASTGSGAPT